MLLGAAIVGASAAPAAAYRPFDQTDGDTAQYGTIELEIGPVRIVHTATGWQADPQFVFNYGFSPGFELVVDVDHYNPLTNGGRHTLQTDVMVKHVLRQGCLQDKTGPSIALETGPLLPSVPQLDDEVGWSAALIISQRWDPVTIHVNVLGEYTRDRAWAWSAGAILEGPDHWAVRPVGEAYFERDAGANLQSYLAGVIWTVRESLTFDAALRLVHDDSMRDPWATELRVGLTWVLHT